MTATARVLAFPEPVNVADLIRAKLAESDIADPHVIAQEIADTLPEAELRAIVGRLLPDSVRKCIHAQRTPLPARGPTRSAKWAAIAERAEEIAIFRQRVCAGGVWKFLGDCTREDVEALVADYRKLAAENAAKASHFDALRRLMGRKKATVVSDLAPETVAEVLA